MNIVNIPMGPIITGVYFMWSIYEQRLLLSGNLKRNKDAHTGQN